eukprot:CAMPEP_0197678936 /NCGR_PEP_ID=MMETSP1338-20131121/90862_1 /TAXON_ID=43686 ORGANISM="Pelagodinium beii, Strain RCC1491" /NCGR_SAMPLE_ID=MMETSP1338 /ASSEMBLY_ACC=CAM_ASM_000754 /LENGTH=47 /DNA_ID= /DNA_START= /DNA_END= /DNA_ORIENTATION=
MQVRRAVGIELLETWRKLEAIIEYLAFRLLQSSSSLLKHAHAASIWF